MKNIARKKVVRFIAFTYLFTWLAWLPGILASKALIPEIPWQPLFALGTCGPLVAALWSLNRDGGWQAVKNWLKRGFTRKISLQWWLFIVAVPFMVPLFSLVLYRLANGGISATSLLSNLWMIFPTSLLMVTIGGGQEEYGWRGYLLPRLDAFVKPWQADCLLVLVHTLWHLPLFFIAYTVQSCYPFWLFLAFGAGFTPLINLIHRKTEQSILVVVLFHGLVNTGLEIFPVVGATVDNSVLPLLLVGILYGMIALFQEKHDEK